MAEVLLNTGNNIRREREGGYTKEFVLHVNISLLVHILHIILYHLIFAIEYNLSKKGHYILRLLIRTSSKTTAH